MKSQYVQIKKERNSTQQYHYIRIKKNLIIYAFIVSQRLKRNGEVK